MGDDADSQIQLEMERISHGEGSIPSLEFLLKALNSEYPRTRNQATWELGALGDRRAINPLLHAREHDRHPWVRHYTAVSLARLGYEGAFDMLMVALRSDDHLMSSSAASALFSYCGKPGRKAVRDALNDGHPNARASAVMVLAQTRGRHTFDMLINALHDKDDRVRSVTTYNLGRRRDLRAVEPLLVALEDESSSVREGAAFALGWLGDLRAVEPLINLMQDESAKVRMSAATALGRLGDERALPVLEWAKEHDEGEWHPGDDVKDCATEAIKRIKRQNRC